MSLTAAILILAGAIAVLALALRAHRQAPPAANASADLLGPLKDEIRSLQGAVDAKIIDLARQMNSQLQANNDFLNQSHETYRQAVGHVERKLGEVQQATRSMLDIGKEISSLQNILLSPKLRGGMGELILEELLKQILPGKHFVFQYGFRNGSKVDAVIILEQGMVPVDAKFPLENFKKMHGVSEEDARAAKKLFISDVKKHIDSISTKYIQPEEGTLDFALMYIPAENVYYEIIIKDDFQAESLAQYAMNKKVIPVSPNSFYAYLQAIMRGLRGFQIESSARAILDSLAQIETDFKKCLTDFEKVGTHLNHAVSSYKAAEKRLDHLSDKLSLIEHTQQSGKDLLSDTPLSAPKTPELI